MHRLRRRLPSARPFRGAGRSEISGFQRRPRRRRTGRRAATCLRQQIVRLVVEKIPLFVLSAISAAITPYAQNHGGSMASPAELSFAFRIENSLQSYLTYITRMFWPGKMSVLYLLDQDHVNHYYTAVAAVGSC